MFLVILEAYLIATGVACTVLLVLATIRYFTSKEVSDENEL